MLPDAVLHYSASLDQGEDADAAHIRACSSIAMEGAQISFNAHLRT